MIIEHWNIHRVHDLAQEQGTTWTTDSFVKEESWSIQRVHKLRCPMEQKTTLVSSTLRIFS